MDTTPQEHATWEEINELKEYIRDFFGEEEGREDEDAFTTFLAEMDDKLPPIEVIERKKAAEKQVEPIKICCSENYQDYPFKIELLRNGRYLGTVFDKSSNDIIFTCKEGSCEEAKEVLLIFIRYNIPLFFERKS